MSKVVVPEPTTTLPPHALSEHNST